MIDLPDIRQKDDHSCGVVAYRVLLRYLRVRRKKAVEPLSSMIDGTDPRAIETYLRELGLNVLAGSMRMEDIESLTDTGRPVICLITPEHGVGHYVVVGGTDERFVYYHCPTHGALIMTRVKFEACWHEVDRLGAKYRRWGIAAWRN